MNTFNEQLFHVLFQNDKYLKLFTEGKQICTHLSTYQLLIRIFLINGSMIDMKLKRNVYEIEYDNTLWIFSLFFC